jgi:hypothetical protein
MRTLLLQSQSTSVANGLNGLSAVPRVEVVWRHEHTISWMEQRVANLAHMVTATFSKESAMSTLAPWIVKVSGVSTHHVLSPVVVETKLGHSKSRKKLCTVAQHVQWQAVPQRILNAVHSSARRIAKVIGMIGLSAPTVEQDPMAWNAVLVDPRVVRTILLRSRLQEDVGVKLACFLTRQPMWLLMPPPLTPVNARSLAAQRNVRALGEHGVSALGQT